MLQKLIAKYGLAAHLAILAVAPLVLFPFCGEGAVAEVLIWLSVPAAFWTVLEPSVRGGEHLHDARWRVVRGISRDPLFWASLAFVGFAGLRALNAGIAFSYDAETSVWFVSSPSLSLLPGVVGSSGDLLFAAALALAVLMQACRHSLGRAARMSFLLLSSALSGLAAVIILVSGYFGLPGAVSALSFGAAGAHSFVGLAFGLYLIGGTVALVAVFERGWNFAFPLLLLSIGANAAGLFAFSPPYLSIAPAGAELLVLIYAFAFSSKALRAAGEFKLLVVGGVSLTLGGLLVAVILPESALGDRLSAFKSFELFSARFWEDRAMLSAMAFKSWTGHLWAGTGIGSFPLDFRFNAKPSDWQVFPRGAAALANGWWLLLTERGLVGAVFFILPFGFLSFTYVRRLIAGVRELSLPHPACLIAPLALLLFVATGFVDCSLLRPDALIATGAFLAVSAASFPRMKRENHG